MLINIEFLAANGVCPTALEEFAFYFGNTDVDIKTIHDTVARISYGDIRPRVPGLDYYRWRASFVSLMLKCFKGNPEYEEDLEYICNSYKTDEWQLHNRRYYNIAGTVHANNLSSSLSSVVSYTNIEMYREEQEIVLSQSNYPSVWMKENYQRLYSTSDFTTVFAEKDGADITVRGVDSNVVVTGNNCHVNANHRGLCLVSKGIGTNVEVQYTPGKSTFRGQTYIDIRSGVVQLTTTSSEDFIIRARPDVTLVLSRSVVSPSGDTYYQRTEVIEFGRGDFIEGKHYTTDASLILRELDDKVAFSYVPFFMTGEKDEEKISKLYRASRVKRLPEYIPVVNPGSQSQVPTIEFRP